MNANETQGLIEKAKEFASNSFVPYSLVPQGACVLCEGNIIFGGCSIENFDFACSACATTVAVLKAVSEGHNKIKAIAVYSSGQNLPYLTGTARQLVWQFGKNAEVIVANDKSVEKFKIFEMLPFAFEGEEE